MHCIAHKIQLVYSMKYCINLSRNYIIWCSHLIKSFYFIHKEFFIGSIKWIMELMKPFIMHPCQPGMHIAIDRWLLILSFELKFFVCRHVFIWGFVSVCKYPEKRNHPSFVNISPTVVIDTSMERSSRVLEHGNTQNFILIFFQKRCF